MFKRYAFMARIAEHKLAKDLESRRAAGSRPHAGEVESD